MKKSSNTLIAGILFVVGLGIYIAKLGKGNSPASQCIERGIQYHKDTSGYPTFTTAPNKGRAAEDVVRERCGRSTSAY